MRIVVLSDTHLRHSELHIPEGDVLVHAGDATMMGTFAEVIKFNEWLGSLPHPVKLFCAGNHDWLFAQDRAFAMSLLTNARYIEDELVDVDGLRLYGSPWQPQFHGWAFNLERGRPLREKWDLIPDDIDILVTHGPPYGILDPGFEEGADGMFRRIHAGDKELLTAVRRIRPRYHLFGHLHEGHGVLEKDGTTFVNAANCNDSYRLVYQPIVLDVAPRSPD
jgi:predicted phosphodiesterase